MTMTIHVMSRMSCVQRVYTYNTGLDDWLHISYFEILFCHINYLHHSSFQLNINCQVSVTTSILCTLFLFYTYLFLFLRLQLMAETLKNVIDQIELLVKILLINKCYCMYLIHCNFLFQTANAINCLQLCFLQLLLLVSGCIIIYISLYFCAFHQWERGGLTIPVSMEFWSVPASATQMLLQMQLSWELS